MALNNAALTAAGGDLTSILLYGQLHSAAAGVAGTSNLCSSARVPVSWTNTNGTLTLSSSLAFTGIAASGAVYSITLWSASTSGTFYGEFVLSGDSTANSSGQYTVTALSLTASAS